MFSLLIGCTNVVLLVTSTDSYPRVWECVCLDKHIICLAVGHHSSMWIGWMIAYVPVHKHTHTHTLTHTHICQCLSGDLDPKHNPHVKCPPYSSHFQPPTGHLILICVTIYWLKSHCFIWCVPFILQVMAADVYGAHDGAYGLKIQSMQSSSIGWVFSIHTL